MDPEPTGIHGSETPHTVRFLKLDDDLLEVPFTEPEHILGGADAGSGFVGDSNPQKGVLFIVFVRCLADDSPRLDACGEPPQRRRPRRRSVSVLREITHILRRQRYTGRGTKASTILGRQRRR